MSADNATEGHRDSATIDCSKDDYNNETIANEHARSLLSALQNFITPLIHATNARRPQDSLRDIPVGPEAAELVSALGKFIAAIIRSPQKNRDPDGIKVSLQESNKPSPAARSLSETSAPQELALIIPENPKIEVNANQGQNQIAMGKLLAGLRQHVFNTMPIRLLCFETQGSDLQIQLIERGRIYVHLASKLQQPSREEEFLSDLEQAVQWYGDRAFAEEKVIDKWVINTAHYAILSHTWIREAPGEVTYGDWNQGALDMKQPGYRKLVNFCKTAARAHGLTLGWMDTVCIDKDSSAELDESIRTMYKWYRDSAVCIVYLAETSQLTEIHKDPWFTRGWTLQELLAPRRIKFYDVNWKEIIEVVNNDKRDSQIRAEIKRATTITREELVNIHGVSLSRRMQWAARRNVTREEDTAYSLMGIFDVSISIAYGEGAERAFFRLVREILSSSPYVLDVFNWAGELPAPWRRISSILPSKPHQYLCRAPNVQLNQLRPIEPVTLTHLGLRIPVLLMPATSVSMDSQPLQHIPVGRYFAIVNINPRETTDDRQIPSTYNVLERRSFLEDGWVDESKFQLTFGILNFTGDETSVRVPKICLAVALSCQEGAGRVTTLGRVIKIDTNAPIVFTLNEMVKGDVEDAVNSYEDYYRINRAELENHHGMQLVILYL